MVYKFFEKKSSGSRVDAETNYQLANELHKQTITKYKRRKVKGGPQKCPYFSVAITFTKIRKL